MVQNILLKESRIVIPSPIHLDILDKICEGHQGLQSAVRVLKALFGGLDLAERSETWCNTAEFAHCTEKAILNR